MKIKANAPTSLNPFCPQVKAVSNRLAAAGKALWMAWWVTWSQVGARLEARGLRIHQVEWQWLR